MNLLQEQTYEKLVLDYFDMVFDIDYICNSQASYLVLEGLSYSQNTSGDINASRKLSDTSDMKRIIINKSQVEMIRRNNGLINGVLQMMADEQNDKIKLYYNITSHIQLSKYLGRKRFLKNEFIQLLLCITNAISECSKYILNENAFVFDIEYMYIQPGTTELGFIYVPIYTSVSLNDKFRAFMSNLIMKGIQLEGETSDDFLQKIITFCKQETFGIKSFELMLRGLIMGKTETKRVKANSGKVIDNDMSNDLDIFNEEAKIKKDFEARNSLVTKGMEHINNSRRIQEKNSARSSIFSKLKKYLLGSIGKPFEEIEIPLHVASEKDTLIDKSIADENSEACTTEEKRLKIKAKPQVITKGFTKVITEGNTTEKVNERTKGRKSNDDKIKFISIKNIKKTRLLNDRTEADRLKEGKSEFTTIPDKHTKNEGELSNKNVLDYQNTMCNQNTLGNKNTLNNKSNLNNGDSNNSTSIITKSADYRDKTVLLRKNSNKQTPFLDINCEGGTKRVEINKESFIIGRFKEHVDFAIDNPAIGRMHAEIIKGDNELYIRDLNSKNGTYINSVRLENSKMYKLKKDDFILLGNVEINVRYY